MRYFWVSTLIVSGLTIVIAITTHKKTSRQVTILFIKVALGVTIFTGAMVVIAYLLKVFGIAEEGFVI